MDEIYFHITRENVGIIHVIRNLTRIKIKKIPKAGDIYIHMLKPTTHVVVEYHHIWSWNISSIA